jgi:DNA-binding FadR family transcriptional regulator
LTLYRLFHEPHESVSRRSSRRRWTPAPVARGDEPLFMRHDRRFHDLVLGATGNERLVATVDGLRDATVTLGASTVDCSRSLPTWPPSTSRS